MANKGAVIVKRDINGGPPLQFFFPEAATQTFKAGKAVYLNGSGHVADFAAGIDSGSQRLLGFAAQGGNNLTTAATANAANTGTYQSQLKGLAGLTGVYITPYTIFEANISSNGSDVTSLLTYPGTYLPLYEDATNGWNYIDVANTGSKIDCVNVLKPAGDQYTVGETNQRFEFTLNPLAIQVGGAVAI